MTGNRFDDKYILNLLEKDPERAMVLVVEQYTALLWKIISLRLDKPEDIRECINDTFAEFYFHKDRFDLQKASLTVYLSAIARNQAISRYRKEQNRRCESQISDMDAVVNHEVGLAELRTDLAQAMSSLRPDELQIIRMKYYEGMTVQEIADSLNLPYETVKKRHQRSIGKLRRAMLLTLIILLLGLVTACTYRILVYYEMIPDFWTEFWNGDLPDPSGGELEESSPAGSLQRAVPTELPNREPEEASSEGQTTVSSGNALQASEASPVIPEAYASYTVIPGYGILANSGSSVYTLSDSSYAENAYLEITLEDAFYTNDVLHIRLAVSSKDASSTPGTYSLPDCPDTVQCHTASWARVWSDAYFPDASSRAVIKEDMTFSISDLPSPENGRLNMLLETHYGLSIPFVLVPAAEESLEKYPCQIEEYGGLLAIPRLENGSLIVAIYPLNDGDNYHIIPRLVQSNYRNTETGTITVTDSNGTTLTGTRIDPDYKKDAAFYEWDFGPAVPGSYTLHVPFLYQMAEAPEDFSILLDLKELVWEERSYPIPGGSIRVESCTPVETPASSRPNPNTYWHLRLHYDSEDENRSPADFYFKKQAIPLSYIQGGGDPLEYTFDDFNYCYQPISAIDETSGTIDLELYLDESQYDASHCYLTFQTGQSFTSSMNTFPVNYRWNQSFDLTFTVE